MPMDTFRCHGQGAPPPNPIQLRAGPLEMLFDPADGFLRRIRLWDREVLRGIYGAVRDHNWGTAPAELHFSSSRICTDSFRLEFVCRHRHAEVDFSWRGLVTGGADGTLVYEFDGEAGAPFRKNRIGLCILHPVRECAGAGVRQIRVDGSERVGRFPGLIEPQIFGRSSLQQLRALHHEAWPGIQAEVDMAGGIFETEDQRNWTDASFKTYCPPLLEPFPVTVRAGERFHQKVTMRLVGAAGNIPPRPQHAREPVLVLPGAPSVRLPSLGVGMASHGGTLDANEVGRLRELCLAHVRVDVHAAAADSPEVLGRALDEAARLEVAIELALHLPQVGEGACPALRTLLERARGRLARVLALRDGEAATSQETLATVRRHLGALGTPIGAGSDCNFCELNRERALDRLALDGSDFVFWPVNPQVHARDHRSVMETLEAQPATVHSARAFAGARPLIVSPVTLRQRFNPVATGAEISPPAGELPAAVDPRQLSQFAAAWLMGSIAALAVAGVESATYFETTGWRGLMERASGSPQPDLFPSQPGEVFPVWRVLADLAGFRQAAVVAAKAVDGVVAIVLFSPAGRERAHLANLAGEAREVRIEGCPRPRRLTLAPYAVERLEMEP
jgi:D-apionolactonase